MPAINLPFNIINGHPLDADQVMANEGSIVSVVNGSLEMGANVRSAAPSASITGKTSSEGVSASAMRSDAQFVIQGFENAASDPATGNFVGRSYYNTVTSQTRLCIVATGSGTWVSMGNPLASELVVHAAEHKDGGNDPLADNTLSDHMFAAKANIFSATLGSDHTSISTTTFSTIVDLTTLTTTGVQTIGVYVTLIAQPGPNAATHNFGFRVVDVTASNTTIYKSNTIELHTQGVQQQVSGFFYYSTPAGGARTLRVAAGVNSGNDCTIVAPVSFNSETVLAPTITAVIL